VRVPPNTVPSDTVVGLTEAQLLFGSSAGAIAQSSLLSWDDTLKSLSVTGTVTKVSAAASVWDTLKLPAATITLTGGTGVTALSQLTLGAGTITSASATTVTDAAAVYIPAAPAAGGSVTLTRTFALWVDSGISRLDGQVFLGAATGNATAPLSITVGGTPEALTGFQGTPGVVVFKDGPADFFVGRNVTNNVEVFLGTTGTASATLGTATNHLLAIYTNGTVKFVIGADGTLYGTALHNVGTLTGTTTQYIGSGTYTPTLTGVTNIAASTARQCTWARVGNWVHVAGQLDVDPTAAAASALGISLPIASDFTTAYQCGGNGMSTAVADGAAGIVADATNNRAEMQWVAVSTANHTVAFSFAYEVV
jgi:hypothetical protein